MNSKTAATKIFFLSFASCTFQNKEKEEEQLPWHSVAVKHNATKTTDENKMGMSMITHMNAKLMNGLFSLFF